MDKADPQPSSGQRGGPGTPGRPAGLRRLRRPSARREDGRSKDLPRPRHRDIPQQEPQHGRSSITDPEHNDPQQVPEGATDPEQADRQQVRESLTDPVRRRAPGDHLPEPCAEPQGDGEAATELDHPVVAGYDGSQSSRNALAYAAGMSRRLCRPLLVVYVCSPGVYCEPLTGQVIGSGRDTDEMTRWLMRELDDSCDRSGLDVCVVTRRGSPARELAAAADEFSADALVIGAPQHLWHHLAGSVPGWLARHAHCPVIVVP
jgi:nucleotide-binding universal stress UspA family protein